MIAPNLHVCLHMVHPEHCTGSMRDLNRLPSCVGSPRSIAGQPSLKQAPQALHFTGSTSHVPAFISLAAMRQGPPAITTDGFWGRAQTPPEPIWRLSF